MQNFEPDPDPTFETIFGTEFFIPILVMLFVILILVRIVKGLMGGGGSRSSSSMETEKESVKKSNLCGNCKLEPIYDSDSGLCRYCVKYN